MRAMDIQIPQRAQYSDSVRRDELEIARKFTHAVQKEMGKFVKGVILFGSSARHTSTPNSDIDMLVLIDDLSTYITRDVADAYRIVIQRLINQNSRRLHVVTLRLTAFWDYIRNGDPIGINMLRDGISMWDSGFFEPLQLLLKKGRIRPTDESIWAYYLKAPTTLKNAKWHVMQGVVDLYWAVIDAAHAALMSQNAVPPTPEHVADMLDEVLVNKGLLEREYSKIMRNMYERAKMILHYELHEVRGIDFDHYLEDANRFVERMKVFIGERPK
ncbi:nucleotidyltransferase domain-containing protein [Candidatus Woesearchaeota archaeon]|nr:nucleotidyltransferase domain-containing protein [Candidatus Woesearchaeota archaeon]